MSLDLPHADNRRLLRNDVFDELLHSILVGELPPGARLKDADLTARLGVSRTPVREALGRLATVGLVRSSPNRFTLVAPVEPDEILGAVAVLRVLYPEALRAFAGASAETEPDTELELTLLAARLERDPQANVPDYLRRVSGVVLDRLANRVLRETIEAVRPRVARFLRLTPEGAAAVRREHAIALTRALAEGDPAAERLVGEMLDDISEVLGAPALAGS